MSSLHAAPSGWRRIPPARVAVLALVAVLDVLVLSKIGALFSDGSWFLGVAVLVCIAGLTVAVAVPKLVALRWLSPGLALLALFTLAPIAYTSYIAFTNYSSTHLLTKQQAITSLEKDTYLPPNAPTYQWRAYKNVAGGLALYLVPTKGPAVFAPAGQAGHEVAAPASRAVTDLPATVEGYTQLNTVAAVRSLSALSATVFGAGTATYKVTSLDLAASYQSQYRYDKSSDTVTDKASGTVYRPHAGTFTAADGKTIDPGFQAVNGLKNIRNLFTTPSIAKPVLRIFVWTIAYAVIVVGIQFVIGLALALVLNDSSIGMRLAKAIRSVLLLPYVIPAYLSILVWAAMFNQQLGVIPRWINDLFGVDPSWVGTPNGARAVAIAVTLWLGFPYFLLITSGALQAIPAELLEAAQVDGGSAVQRFRAIVFPMLPSAGRPCGADKTSSHPVPGVGEIDGSCRTSSRMLTSPVDWTSSMADACGCLTAMHHRAATTVDERGSGPSLRGACRPLSSGSQRSSPRAGGARPARPTPPPDCPDRPVRRPGAHLGRPRHHRPHRHRPYSRRG